MAIEIDAHGLLDIGPVNLVDRGRPLPWRGARSPGDDLSDLSPDVSAAITAHWNEDVGGMTRAQRWRAALPAPEPVDLVAYASEARRRKEAAGFTFNGIQVPGDSETMLRVLGSASLPDGRSVPLIINGKRLGRLTGAQFKQLNAAMVDHVALTFEILDGVLAGIAGNSITTTAAIDAAFNR